MLRLTADGWREIAAGTALLLGGAALSVWLGVWPVAVPLLIVWVWLISFFRDPHRRASLTAGEFCAPADGRVTEITRLETYPGIEGPVWRVGIFLSIFNVHVNRSPCAGRVLSVEHTPGRYLDARHPDSGPKNESNTLVIDADQPPSGPVVVRQVAGKIARRIVCHARPEDRLAAAQRFGMIKFGSRTELIVPARDDIEVTVDVGTAVRGGVTVLCRQLSTTAQETRDGDHRQSGAGTASAPA